MIAQMSHTDEMPAHDVDGVLRDFFRAEMPKQWPEPAALEETTQPRLMQKRFWLRNNSRWALAASIALLLTGYLTLAGSFSMSTRTGLGENNPEIGSSKILHDVTKNRRPVEVLEITPPRSIGNGPGRIDVRELPQTPDNRR